MKLASLAAVATVALAYPLAAAAQTGSDCNYAPFPLRPFPKRIIQISVGYHFKDPNNTIIDTVMGRCEPSGQIVFVCGVGARINRAGYVDRARSFFGVYTPMTTPPNFHVHSVGAKADAECKRLVLDTPRPRP